MNYSGLAKIIPFVPRAQVRVGPPWSTAELGELFRVAHVLRQSGMMVETDMGLSDEGDPWFVFYNTQTEDVIAHFARINGEIMVHGLSANGLVSGVDLGDVIRRLKPVQAMESQQKSQAERSVVFHPFMLLVAFVAASFLATEESQAASAPHKAGEAGDHRAADATKIKADWIDRAMVLLNGKGKDRAEAGAPDAPGARKMSASETTTQHSMALAMLAAAITQANQIDSAEFTADTIDLAVEIKSAALPHQLVAHDVSSQGADAVGGNNVQGNAAPGYTAISAYEADRPGTDYNPNAGAEVTATLPGDIELAAGLPLLVASVSVATLTASDLSSGALLSTSQLPQEYLAPESASFGATSTAAGTVATIVGKATVSTLAASSVASTGPTSFDLTLDGGTLQFHQSLIDIRMLEPVAGQGVAQAVDTKGDVNHINTGVILVEGQNGKTLTLTDAHESVLIEKGDIRIKNFAFGVDQLVLQDPSFMEKTPEVLFSYAGDIIIKFNETTRVVLIGVFQASEMVMGVASVEAV